MCSSEYAGLVPKCAPTPDSSVATRSFRLSVGVCLFGGLLTSLISLPVPRLKLLLGFAPRCGRDARAATSHP